MELAFKTLTRIRDILSRKEASVEEVVNACLQVIEKTEPELNALITTCAEEAIEQARQMDNQGPDPEKPLWGVPVVIKDVIATKGIRTTCASKILENFVPCYDATLVEKLKQAGCIILGKTNMDEFAMGSSTENSAFGPTKNPYDLTRVPGGSSGGSAASVAAAQAFASVGTDTGGSIRQPAGFCGIVGLKPTYGRVSRFGLIAYGSSLDQAGPMTRTVRDAALMLQVIAGHDPKDSTSSPEDVPDYVQTLQKANDLKGIRLGYPVEYWEKGLSPEVKDCCEQALNKARELGAEIIPISIKHTPYAIATYYIIAMAEASSNLARYDGVRFGFRDKEATELLEMYFRSRSKGFGEEVKRRIMLGTYVLSAGYYDAYYKKAAQVRRLIRQDFLDALKACDLICAPVAPTTAFKLGENIDDPLQMYLTDIFTISLNLTGLPGMTLPVGLGQETNMPVGMQFFGPAFGEEIIFQVCHVLEQALQGPGLPHVLKDEG